MGIWWAAGFSTAAIRIIDDDARGRRRYELTDTFSSASAVCFFEKHTHTHHCIYLSRLANGWWRCSNQQVYSHPSVREACALCLSSTVGFNCFILVQLNPQWVQAARWPCSGAYSQLHWALHQAWYLWIAMSLPCF